MAVNQSIQISNFVKHLIQNVENAHGYPARCETSIELFIYLMTHPTIADDHPDLAISLRQKCQNAHFIINEMFNIGRITYDIRNQLIQTVGNLLIKTQHLSHLIEVNIFPHPGPNTASGAMPQFAPAPNNNNNN